MAKEFFDKLYMYTDCIKKEFMVFFFCNLSDISSLFVGKKKAKF